MPRASVEMFSHFGANTKNAPSQPMPIRILQSRRQPGHVNILMNPEQDASWVDIVEAYDVDARDILEALCRLGVLQSYTLAQPKEKHEVTGFENTILSEGRVVPPQELSKVIQKLTERAAEVYT